VDAAGGPRTFLVTDPMAKTARKPASSRPKRDAAAPSPELIRDLVTANHILFQQGVVDGFGHVSVRHDRDPGKFLLARNMAPALVTPNDILVFDLDGQSVSRNAPPVYLERFIHSEVYRARSDVNSVVHSHSPAVIPFGVVPEVSLQPIFHMSAFLGDGCPIFEIRKAGGPGTDILIRSAELGAAMARDLGAHSAILMRGHGATVVADQLKRAVYRAVYMQVNAELQTVANSLGRINFLNAEESKAATKSVEGQLQRAWDMWALMSRNRGVGAR
jgi:ribulose-5-phosphate 4-epimerase/fuculose-1-phosphate aldolase